MTQETSLTTRLITDVLDHTDHPAKAAAALMAAAGTILARSFGEDEAIELMAMMIDQAGADLRFERLSRAR